MKCACPPANRVLRSPSTLFTKTRSAQIIVALTIAGHGVLGHTQMSYPYPFRSAYDPANNYTNIDYSMTAPLLTDGSNFPCKGYYTVIESGNYPTVDTITARESYTVS